MNFEGRRNAFNANHRRSSSATMRGLQLRELGELLVDVSRTSMGEPPPDPPVYHKDGLKVWKTELGVGRLLIRAEFIVAISPLRYCQFASNPANRSKWDLNVKEVKCVEKVGPNCQVNYIATKRVHTIFPRDTVSLRILKRLPNQDEYVHQASTFSPTRDSASLGMTCDTTTTRSDAIGVRRNGSMISGGIECCENQSRRFIERPAEKGEKGIIEKQDMVAATVAHLLPGTKLEKEEEEILAATEETSGTYTSCSCSIEHPDVPEQEGRVRADLRIGSYVAEPFPTNYGLWSRICSFNEGDPRGWIPGSVVRMVAASVVPKSVESLVSSLMTHYNIPVSGGNATGYAHRLLQEKNE